MDPQQELFSELLEIMKSGPYAIYDGALPPDGTPYPFIYLADSQQLDEANKSGVFGRVSQSIHVWHNDPRRRGTVSKMLLYIKRICRELHHTANFGWFVVDVSQRILPDSTTKQPLVHGVLEIEFKFS